VVEWLATTAMWCLGFVFLHSGTAKLRDIPLAATTLVDFGLLSRPRADAGFAVGAYEVALGAALFAAIVGMAPRRLVAILAVLTLLGFSILLVRSLRSGADFACNCFGSSSKPIARSDAIRTAVLLAVGIVALAGPATLAEAHVPSAPISAIACLLGASLLVAVPALLKVNADPPGEDPSRWERRLHD
jgi:hypothetical protein